MRVLGLGLALGCVIFKWVIRGRGGGGGGGGGEEGGRVRGGASACGVLEGGTCTIAVMGWCRGPCY